MLQRFNQFGLVVLSLVLLFVFTSCTRDYSDGIGQINEAGKKAVTERTLNFGQMHNDFIIWMYDNHLDSCVYYQGDDPAFSTFVRKKFEDYFEVELTDFSSYVIDLPPKNRTVSLV
jgi:hypothetical protein